MTPLNIYRAAAGALAWFGLLMQAQVSFSIMLHEGLPLLEVAHRYGSFFTITTNALVALCYTTHLLRPKSHVFFARPDVEAGLALTVVFVCVIYELALRKLRVLSGWALAADVVLHDVTPALFVIYWALFVRKGHLRWSSPAWWLLYPLFYLINALIEGRIYHAYPYPFLDADKYGYRAITINCVVLLATFAVAGVLLVRLDHWWGRNVTAEPDNHSY